LPDEYRPIAHAFHPTGRANFTAYIRREPNARKLNNSFLVTFHHATARYDVFAYPLENVSGVLDIRPDHWEFRDFRASHKGGEFRTHGRSFPGGKGPDRVEVYIAGTGMALDQELQDALAPYPELTGAWRALHPGGRMDFECKVGLLLDQPGPPDVTLALWPRGCSARPSFFAYTVDDITGVVSYAEGRVTLRQLRGRHGRTQLGLDEGFVQLKPG